MKTLATRMALLLALALPAAARADDASMDLTEAGLNKVVARLGKLSDAGSFQPAVLTTMKGLVTECDPVGWLDCPMAGRARIPLGRCKRVGGGYSYVPTVAPVTWSWRVSSAAFDINAGAMTFTASILSQVGTQQTTVSRTVPVTISFDASASRLRVNIGSFTVPVQTAASGQTETITTVDVAKLYSVSVPVVAQHMQIAMPNGTTKNLTAKVLSMSPQFMANVLHLAVNVGF